MLLICKTFFPQDFNKRVFLSLLEWIGFPDVPREQKYMRVLAELFNGGGPLLSLSKHEEGDIIRNHLKHTSAFYNTLREAAEIYDPVYTSVHLLRAFISHLEIS